MLEALLRKLFIKLEQEPTNDKKSKNGCAIYFIEQILEERFKKFNIISTRGLKDYYDKHVLGKENSSGEPNTELKNIISEYLGYDSFLDFETKTKGATNTSTKTTTTSIQKKLSLNVQSIKKFGLPAALFGLLIFGSNVTDVFKSEDCIVWRKDHYEKIDCKNENAILMLEGINIDKFRKIQINESTIFFKKNKPIVWYGKSEKGEMEYFNARGTHPITGKELKLITEYIINKYITNSK